MGRRRARRGRERGSCRWLFAFALVLAVAMFAMQSRDQWQFATLVARARPEWLLLGALLQLATYYSEARIWQRPLQRADVHAPLRDYIGLGLAKLFLDHTVPTGGVERDLPRGARARSPRRPARGEHGERRRDAGQPLPEPRLRHDRRARLADRDRHLHALPAAAGGDLRLPGDRAADRAPLHDAAAASGCPRWVLRVPLLRSALQAVAEAAPEVARDGRLIARCTLLQLSVLVLDALTLWAMLLALGLSVDPAPVCASFMLSTLARILGIVPGGLGVFEVVSVATLRAVGVPVAAGIAATLMFRGFSFWLPLLPATIFARRETRETLSSGEPQLAIEASQADLTRLKVSIAFALRSSACSATSRSCSFLGSLSQPCGTSNCTVKGTPGEHAPAPPAPRALRLPGTGLRCRGSARRARPTAGTGRRPSRGRRGSEGGLRSAANAAGAIGSSIRSMPSVSRPSAAT